MSAEQALLFLEDVRERLSQIALTSDEYYAAIRESAKTGVFGGTIHDALIARCAVKAKADVIYTWNIRYFEQLGPIIGDRLKTP